MAATRSRRRRPSRPLRRSDFDLTIALLFVAIVGSVMAAAAVVEYLAWAAQF